MNLVIHPADDLIGISMERVLRYHETYEKNKHLLLNWEKTIIIHLNNFYSVSVVFSGSEVSFKVGEVPNPDLRISMSLNTLLDIANSRLNPFIAVLIGKLKIKSIFKIGLLLRFYKVFLVPLKKISQVENTNYFEVYKESR